MPQPNVIQAINDDLDTALDLLRDLKLVQTGVLDAINAHANAASAEGDADLDIALTRKAIALSQGNLRIATAERAERRAKSLARPIAKLQDITREAKALRNDLDDVAKALAAAERLITLLGRLTGVFR